MQGFLNLFDSLQDVGFFYPDTSDFLVELILLQDSISFDPGIADDPLRSAWNGIYF